MAGDGFAGVPARAPYDRIIVTAAAETIPQTLLDQLADGGVMLLPVGPHDGSQHIIKLTKSQTGIKREDLIAVRFVPLLPGQARELTGHFPYARSSEDRCPLLGSCACDIFAGLTAYPALSGNS